MLSYMKEILLKIFCSGRYSDRLATRVWGDSPQDEP